MLSATDILLGIVVPVVVSAILLAILTIPWRSLTDWRVALAWSLAVGVAFAVGSIGVLGRPGRPWVPEDWLLVAVAPATALVGVLAYSRLPAIVIWGLRLAVSIATPIVICQSYLGQIGGDFAFWTPGEAAAWMAGWSLVLFATWTALTWRIRRGAGRSVPIAVMFIAGGAGLVVFMSDSQSIGQLGLALAAAILGGVAASLLLPRDKAAAGSVDIAWMVTAGLLIVGRHYAEYEPTNAKWALLAAAPLMVWIPALPGIRSRPRGLRGVLVVAAVLVPVGTAVGLAFAKFYREMSDAGFL